MMAVVTRFFALLLVLTSACYVSVDHGNQYSCQETETCPLGLFCEAGRCVETRGSADAGSDGQSSPTDSGAPSDADQIGATITAVDAYDIGPTEVTITWTVSEVATGQTEYGDTTLYGNLSTLEDSFVYATHIQRIPDLVPNTLYHYRVHSKTMSGEELVSDDFTFSTLPPL